MRDINIAPVVISVVVCVYNEEQCLRSCLESLKSQCASALRFQVIIVDDDSHDNSGGIAKEFVAERIGSGHDWSYVKVKHGGLSAARNTGIYYSSGEIVAFIDGDAVADVNWLFEIHNVFNNESRIAVVGGEVRLSNSDCWFARMIHSVHYERRDKTKPYIVGTNMAFRRTIFNEYGGFYIIFDRRGDETTINEIIGRRHTLKEAASVVVYHEQPKKPSEWLKVRWQNGIYGAWAKHVTAQDSDDRCGFTTRRVAQFFAGLLMVIVLMSILIIIIEMKYVWIIILVAIVCLGIRQRNKATGLVSYMNKNLPHENFITHLYLAILIVLGNFMSAIGKILGEMRWRRHRNFDNKIQSRDIVEFFPANDS